MEEAEENSSSAKVELREKAKSHWLVRWCKRLLILALMLIAVGGFMIWYANHAATRAGKGILYNDVTDIPHRPAGLVFGCSEKLGDRENLYFKYRIEAAAELWHARKVDFLIVSGDKGVPFDKVVCDYAGLRTLDSVVRAKKIFGCDELILVSQKFQNERAAYIAKANDMKVFGYNAKDVGGYAARKTEDREILARVKMWIDINITNQQPKYLGEPVSLPE